MNKTFNIIISGVGGQGLITLTKIIAEACRIEKKDVKTSELHGLSQRGGSVQTHIRFGERVWSPLITENKADLIIGLEITEALRNIFYLKPEGAVISDKYQLFYPDALDKEEAIKKINSISIKRKYLIDALSVCKDKLDSEVVSGIYLLSIGVFNKIIPLSADSVIEAIEKIVPEKYVELNKKAFKLSKQ
ncbi:MAG: indolepyruvate oxidoreductase subunit beta [Candidatus Pacebacteria bacterium]|nr:indolepyruvate oxidoreductase subunit beta [Candidatus Paceibacterota bacterium]